MWACRNSRIDASATRSSSTGLRSIPSQYIQNKVKNLRIPSRERMKVILCFNFYRKGITIRRVHPELDKTIWFSKQKMLLTKMSQFALIMLFCSVNLVCKYELNKCKLIITIGTQQDILNNIFKSRRLTTPSICGSQFYSTFQPLNRSRHSCTLLRDSAKVIVYELINRNL